MFYPVTLINPVYQMLWVDNCLACLTWEWLYLGYEMQLSSVNEMYLCQDKIIYNLNGTWRTTQDNSTTTVHVALA
jgi:hypothetical protein